MIATREFPTPSTILRLEHVVHLRCHRRAIAKHRKLDERLRSKKWQPSPLRGARSPTTMPFALARMGSRLAARRSSTRNASPSRYLASTMASSRTSRSANLPDGGTCALRM